MHDKIRIQLVGKDDVLAAILAEQAGESFEFSYAPDGENAAQYNTTDVTLKVGPVKPAVQGQNAPESVILFVHDGQENAASEGAAIFAKPIRLAALLDAALGGARLRRMKQPRQLLAGVTFHPFVRNIEGKGQQIALTEKEAQFLLAVLVTGQKGLPRVQAMREVWNYHPDADSHAVDTTLYRLRQKLQVISGLDACLVNEDGVYHWRSD